MSFKKTLSLYALLTLHQVSFSQVSNNMLNFDGLDDYVNLNVVQQTMYNNSDAFTIEFRMRGLTANQTSSIRTTMFAINEPTGDNRLLLIMGGPSTQDGNLMVYGDGGSGAAALYTSSIEIGDGKCHHIAYSFDASSATGTVYIDGAVVNTHSTTFGITASDRYSLGQEYDNLTTSQFYNGDLEEIRLWGTVRTQSEIQGNMYGSVLGTEPDLLAYYQCNQGIPSGLNTSITSLNDVSAANLDGTLDGFLLNSAVSNFVLNTCASTISLAEAFMNAISIYPNPTNGICTIEGESLNHAVVGVYSLLGEVIQQEQKHTFPIELDFSEHEPSFYFIRIVSDEGEKVVKVVVE